MPLRGAGGDAAIWFGIINYILVIYPSGRTKCVQFCSSKISAAVA